VSAKTRRRPSRAPRRRRRQREAVRSADPDASGRIEHLRRSGVGTAATASEDPGRVLACRRLMAECCSSTPSIRSRDRTASRVACVRRGARARPPAVFALTLVPILLLFRPHQPRGLRKEPSMPVVPKRFACDEHAMLLHPRHRSETLAPRARGLHEALPWGRARRKITAMSGWGRRPVLRRRIRSRPRIGVLPSTRRGRFAATFSDNVSWGSVLAAAICAIVILAESLHRSRGSGSATSFRRAPRAGKSSLGLRAPRARTRTRWSRGPAAL